MSVPWNQLTREEQRMRLLRSWRLAIPFLFTALTLLVMLLPLWVAGPLLPQTGLLGVTYWVLARRSLMPPVAMFLLGVLQDLWLGAPLGVNALLLMLAGLIYSGQALVFASRPFSFGWMVMLPAALVYCALQWALVAMLHGPSPMLPILLQALTTSLCYPLAQSLHSRVQRRMVEPYFQDDE